jgi:hypothetical protein
MCSGSYTDQRSSLFPAFRLGNQVQLYLGSVYGTNIALRDFHQELIQFSMFLYLVCCLLSSGEYHTRSYCDYSHGGEGSKLDYFFLASRHAELMLAIFDGLDAQLSQTKPVTGDRPL